MTDITNKNLLSRGFTLIELLLALAITGIVISLSGSGLYALMNANQRSQIETMNRLELEQALAFMTDEIKMSQQIMTNIPSPGTKDKGFTPASGSSRVQPVLVLKPAANSGLTSPIIYYLADPPNDSVWIGPRVIYRWGPTLLQNGNYSDGNDRDLTLTSGSTPVEYFNEVVIDRMSDLKLDRTKMICDNPNSRINYKATIESNGFYACINLDRKSAELWLNQQAHPSAKSRPLNALVVTRSN